MVIHLWSHGYHLVICCIALNDGKQRGQLIQVIDLTISITRLTSTKMTKIMFFVSCIPTVLISSILCSISFIHMSVFPFKGVPSAMFMDQCHFDFVFKDFATNDTADHTKIASH